MTPMIPDCGVLTTPRRSPAIKLNDEGVMRITSPTFASLAYKSPPRSVYKSPPRSSEEVGVTLSTGFNFGFYKSSKLNATPPRRSEPEHVVRRGSKHRKDAINKGVSHKIKRPKPRSKDFKRNRRDAKTIMKRLKEGNFTPCPWIPANRSPLRKTPKSEGKKKRHVLASPGMSLLEDDQPRSLIQTALPRSSGVGSSSSLGGRSLLTTPPSCNISSLPTTVETSIVTSQHTALKIPPEDMESDDLNKSQDVESDDANKSQDVESDDANKPQDVKSDNLNNKRFFTSRCRASANINIGKNVLLAAKNGDITLKQKEGAFLKKNVGRVIEEQLEQFINQSLTTLSLPTPSALPSVTVNPRSKPTRVPTTPSPPKRQLSPRRKKLYSPNKVTHLYEAIPSETLTGVERLSDDIDENDLATPVDEKRSSSATRESPVECPYTKSPTRKSPRKCPSNKTPTKKLPKNSLSSETPTRRSPRKCLPMETPTQKSPRKSLSTRNCSTRKILPATVDSSTSESVDSTSESVDSTSESVDSTPESVDSTPESDSSPSEPRKMFAVFDRQRCRTDSSPSKVKKSCQKHHGMQHKTNSSQTVIDAGQKDFGARQCPDCGIVYEMANPEDEASHEYHHNATLNALKFPGWKKENVVRDLDELGGRIVMVTSTDPHYCWRKVEEVLKVVDEELGFSESGIKVKENTWVFLYVLTRKVVGCLIGERINGANRVLPSKYQSNNLNRLLCCSKDQVPVWAGVSRLWVLESHRSKGIASKLTDALRYNMSSTYHLSKNNIAFSDPTESGARFAEKYAGRRDFLVYRR